MTHSPELKALLSDEVTRAVLRADGLALGDFIHTLDAAAARVARSRRVRSDASPAPFAARKSVFSFACCGA